MSHNGCTLQWTVDHGAQMLFGTNTPKCDVAAPPEFLPVVFWFFTYVPTAKSSATFCTPAISLWDVSATLDLASGNLTKVVELAPFDGGRSKFASLSGNITGAPLNGRAYNGIDFTIEKPDKFILGMFFFMHYCYCAEMCIV
jgi:hypothetical protein